MVHYHTALIPHLNRGEGDDERRQTYRPSIHSSLKKAHGSIEESDFVLMLFLVGVSCTAALRSNRKRCFSCLPPPYFN